LPFIIAIYRKKLCAQCKYYEIQPSMHIQGGKGIIHNLLRELLADHASG